VEFYLRELKRKKRRKKRERRRRRGDGERGHKN
jgi:hypothetical protein